MRAPWRSSLALLLAGELRPSAIACVRAVTSYGVGGMLLVSSLPIILHPVIVFGILSGLSDPAILSIVFAGRTLKYHVMSYITVHAPSALRFFGIKTDLVEYATKAIRGDAAK